MKRSKARGHGPRAGTAVVACIAWCIALALGGCSGAQTRLSLFSTDWEDDRGASIARVWARVGAAPIRPSADVVVGIGGHNDKLIGLPLAGGSKWTLSHPLDGRPIVTGSVVVGAGGGEVFAADAQTGGVLWRRSTGPVALLGAGDDATVTVVTFRPAGGLGSVLLAVTRDGQVVRRIESSRALGAPAVVGQLAFIPWAGQYVSVINLSSGDETARVTLRSETSHAWTTGGSLWFGEGSFIRFDEHVSDASKGNASMVVLPVRELPGKPKLMAKGSEPVATAASADDKVHLYARPAGRATLGLEDSRWYATYFRIAMGFDAGTASKPGDAGRLAWVHLHGADFIAGAAGVGGVVLCDEQGKVTELDAETGSVLSEVELGEPLKACVVGVDAKALSGVGAEARPLAAQLAEAVLADDPQLVVAQKLLLRELAALQDETATKALVDLASDPRTSPDLLADARTALANRRNGPAFMEAALARHYDFLRDVLRSPPVGPIAQALGAMKEKAAAPLLAAHLLDPADTNDDVMRAAAALAVVAGPAELPSLRQFFGMYRASADDDDIAAAVVSVGQALLDLDDKVGRGMVLAAVDDATTVPYARERLQAVVSEQRQAQATAASGATTDTQKGQGKKGK